jgi:hypothetical protein
MTHPSAPSCWRAWRWAHRRAVEREDVHEHRAVALGRQTDIREPSREGLLARHAALADRLVLGERIETVRESCVWRSGSAMRAGVSRALPADQ